MKAWDSIVGHHMGLTNAHKTFTKGKSATNEEPIYELYRNGIVHGSQLNYDNIVVATKAWNRLFAVADWAKARIKENEPEPSKPSWRELLGQLADNQQRQRANDAWEQATLHLGQDEFELHPAYSVADSFMSLWAKRNYGNMAKLVSPAERNVAAGAMPHQIRVEYSPYVLSGYQITTIDHSAPAACIITANLPLAGGSEQTVSMRWIFEDDKGTPVASSLAGSWRLYVWSPVAFLEQPPID